MTEVLYHEQRQYFEYNTFYDDVSQPADYFNLL